MTVTNALVVAGGITGYSAETASVPERRRKTLVEWAAQFVGVGRGRTALSADQSGFCGECLHVSAVVA